MIVEVSWSAHVVSPFEELDGAPIFDRRVRIDGGHGAIRSAVWHVSSLGVFEAAIDGRPVSDDVLSPGWTAYESRLRYRSYDVAQWLHDGARLSLAVGNGWYRGRLGWSGAGELYGDRLGVIAQLEIDFEDGHRQVIVTDTDWKCHASTTIENDLYDGQTIDARRDPTGADAVAVEAIDFDTARLVPYLGPPVRRHESVAPQRIWTSPSGKTLVDFGQNLVGWVRLRVRGQAGTTITVRHAEVLEHDELGTRPLRTAKATDRFVLSGGDDSFEPTFTFHGFRYIEINGHPGPLDPHAIEAVVVHSDLRRTGTFRCSDDLLNRLHDNVVWSLRGNFLDLPTDCPQRDERLGWTGDLAVFAPTAAFLYDVGPFLQDWLLDLSVEQAHHDGRVPAVIPDALKLQPADGIKLDSTAIWSDAAVWAPWALWRAYGDSKVLQVQLPSMLAHVRRVAGLVSPTGLWDRGFQFGDWLDPDAPPENPAAAKADRGVVATACLYRSASIVAEAASLLGRTEAGEMAELADRTRAAFNQHYVGVDGRIRSDAPTVYALAIVFGLLDEHVDAAGLRLAQLVRESGHHISTGFAGTPYITDALTLTGHVDDAYRLLLQQECPSWLYPVTMGATTVWERWDSMLPDGSINLGEMTSFNHYALGAVADWMHRTVGGIAPLEPGYDQVLVAPRPGGGLRWAETSLETRHGPVTVGWRVEGDDLVVDVSLPPSISGVLDLPDGTREELTGRTTHRSRATTA